MKIPSIVGAALILLLIVPVSNFSTTAQAAGGADEKAVRDADDAWSKAAGAKDVDKTISYYADDAIVLPPNAPMVTSKDAIRNLWKGFLDSFSTISWNTTRVEVSKGGDMAVTTGTYQLTMKDGTTDRGKYCEVWEKKGGAWKVATDMFSSDLPAQPMASVSPSAEKQ
ncbi:MAG TPA: DUF4440 domain-containing protein [Chthoniobacterales bacterium]|nr:DUF4440 domain-containing protein [Chthoniobacterales bacterium]